MLALQSKSPEQFERVKRGELAASKALNEIRLTDKRVLADIILQADARIGELTREMPKAPAKGAGRGVGSVPSGNKPKSTGLDSEGISRKQAAECERIAKPSLLCALSAVSAS